MNQPMFIIHVDFIPDTATVSLHSSWYWSDWPASQSLCESAPCSCKKTRMFSAHNNWFLYSAGKSTGTTGYISSSYFRYGLKVLFPAMRRKSAVLPETRCWKRDALLYSLSRQKWHRQFVPDFGSAVSSMQRKIGWVVRLSGIRCKVILAVVFMNRE